MSLSNNYPTIKPSLLLDFANTKQLDPRITFTRTSTATYYDGVTTAMAEQNLLTYSQEFDNAAWQKLNTTITANSIAAPDGTATADTLSASGTALNSVYRTMGNLGVTGNNTISFYAKAGTKSFVRFDCNAALGNGSLDFRANFDISTGVLGTVDAYLTATITSAANGWYRCTVSWNRTSTTSANGIISMADSSSSAFSATSTAGDLYLWGAQLEQRSSVTAYTATTTQPITNYIPVLLTAAAGIPRFNHNPTTGESLGLLIEESRTNLLTYSADWSNAAWTKGGATISADSNVAPDGTLTADRLVEDTSTGDHRAFQLTAFTSGTAYTFTVYAKASGRNLLMLANTMAGGFTSVFDLNAGTITSTTLGTAAITNVGNGWYRCSVSNTSGFTGNSNNQTRLVDTGTNTSYTGNGFSGVFLWGAQLEAGSVATSYVPTVAATVTRSADNASMTGTNFSSWYRPDEGSIYVDAIANYGSGAWAVLAALYSGEAGYRNLLLIRKTTNNTLNTYLDANGQSVNLGGSLSAVGATKVAVGLKAGDYAQSLNGAAASTSSSPTAMIANQTGLSIGNTSPFGTSFLCGTIKKIAFYPARLTNAQLQALTTV